MIDLKKGIKWTKELVPGDKVKILSKEWFEKHCKKFKQDLDVYYEYHPLEGYVLIPEWLVEKSAETEVEVQEVVKLLGFNTYKLEASGFLFWPRDALVWIG